MRTPTFSIEVITLKVSDVDTRNFLLDVGQVKEIRHKTPTGAWDGTFAREPDPTRADYASFANLPIRIATATCYRNGALLILSFS